MDKLEVLAADYAASVGATQIRRKIPLAPDHRLARQVSLLRR
jgi:hypothetical protein